MTDHRPHDVDASVTRARDIDRVSVMGMLDNALMDGQLDYIEHSRRVTVVGEATTMGELASITADLQPSEPAEISDSPAGAESGWRRGRRRLVLVGAAILVAVIAATATVTTLVSDDDAPSRVAVPGDPSIAGAMFTADAIRDVVQATRERFSTTVVEGIHLYAESAELYVFDPASPVGHTHYDYSPGGEFHSPEYYSGLAVSSGDAPVDLAKIDVERVVGLIASAPTRLGVSGANVSNNQFRVTVGGDDGGEIWMGVNGIAIDSHLVAHLDGTIKGVSRCGWGC